MPGPKCSNSANGCQRNADPNKNGLCAVCHRVTQRAIQNRDARDAQGNDRRNIGNNGVPDINNEVNFPAAPLVQPPALDMAEMNRLYQAASAGDEVNTNDVMKQTLSMMMHMAQNMSKVDEVKNSVQVNSDHSAPRKDKSDKNQII